MSPPWPGFAHDWRLAPSPNPPRRSTPPTAEMGTASGNFHSALRSQGAGRQGVKHPVAAATSIRQYLPLRANIYPRTESSRMIRLVCADFDAYDEAMPNVHGRRVLRARQQRDWRLRTVDLQGLVLTMGRDGAASMYSGV